MTNKTNNEPKIKHHQGKISMASWDGVDKEGKPYTSISLQKRVKNKEGEFENQTIYLFSNELADLLAVAHRMDGDVHRSD